MEKNNPKQLIKNLVLKYEKDRDYYTSIKYNEAQLRSDFLDLFFEYLNWDIKNKKGKTTNEREVVLEEGLKSEINENSKKPDYTFRLFSERKFFVEAKKPNVQIENNPDSAKQVRRYGFTAKLKISVLSNFEYLSIYDCSEEVEESDTVNTALIKRYHYTEYEKYFDEIFNYLGQDNVYTGVFDTIWSHIEGKINKFSVDDLFLKQINDWRFILGKEIYKHDNELNEKRLNDIVQGYLNSIIFLRVCEDRDLEEYKTLLSFATKDDFKALLAKFEEADKKYNSGLFDLPLKDKIVSDNKSIFWEIIKKLYYPESPYSFSVFSSDILGNIYEIFLAQRLYIKDENIYLENKPEHVDRDIITTPTFIIKDILRQTILPYCSDKNSEQILGSKFADISCGSGAFLLEAFQLLCDTLVDYYIENDKEKIIQTSIDTYKLKFEVKKNLLLNCIFGVDKDYNAVCACKFGLLLKLLESENDSTVSHELPILPNLDNNICFGNSLLSSDQIEDDYEDINPFDFINNYDVIIGNPPYMKSEDMKTFTPKEVSLYKKNYESAFKQYDKYFLFIERGLNLLNKGGYLGYIVPSKFTKVGAGKNLRDLLKKSKNISRIISFGANQIFSDKTTYTSILILNKNVRTELEYCEVDNLSKWKYRDISDDNFDTISYDYLSSDFWVLIPSKLKETYRKIEDVCLPLGELIGEENIFNGIQTSANKIYINKPISVDDNYIYFKNGDQEWRVEKELTRPYFQTVNGQNGLYTYRKLQPNSFVLYPYKKIDGEIKFIKIDELKEKFPFAHDYFIHHKEELSNPKRDIKPTPKTNNEWYRYGRHQSLDKCEVSKKIVVGVLSQGNKYAIDVNKTLISSGGTAGYCIITVPEDFNYSIYYIQALLNSKYLEWYSSLLGEVFRGGYIARGTKILKHLPIRKIDFNQKEEKKLHDEIATIQESLIDLQEKIDENSDDKRLQKPFIVRFNLLEKKLDELLKNLYSLENDELIPLISDIYATN